MVAPVVAQQGEPGQVLAQVSPVRVPREVAAAAITAEAGAVREARAVMHPEAAVVPLARGRRFLAAPTLLVLLV